MGLFVFAWVHSCASKDRQVHSASLLKVARCSLGRVLGSSCLFLFAWVHSGGPSCRSIHWVSDGFNRALLWFMGFRVVLKVAGFIQVSVNSLWRARGRPMHSGLGGFTRAYLCVFGFIRIFVSSLGQGWGSSCSFASPWIHSGASSDGRGSHGFTSARLVVSGTFALA